MNRTGHGVGSLGVKRAGGFGSSEHGWSRVACEDSEQRGKRGKKKRERAKSVRKKRRVERNRNSEEGKTHLCFDFKATFLSSKTSIKLLPYKLPGPLYSSSPLFPPNPSNPSSSNSQPLVPSSNAPPINSPPLFPSTTKLALNVFCARDNLF